MQTLLEKVQQRQSPADRRLWAPFIGGPGERTRMVHLITYTNTYDYVKVTSATYPYQLQRPQPSGCLYLLMKTTP